MKSDLDTFRNGAGRALDERTEAQLAELVRLEELGFRCMRALDEKVGQLDPGADIALFLRPKNGIVAEYIRLQRAIRQAIILQRELEGLRPPRVIRAPRKRRPDSEDDLREPQDTATERDRADPRDDWDRLDTKPVDEAMDWIRQALGAGPPERDPGPPESTPAPPAPPAPAASSVKPAQKGRLRATLFHTTHISSHISLAAPVAPPLRVRHPAPAPWQPPRGPP